MDILKSKGTILIVDDEADTLWFISKTSQSFGYDVITAGSGTEALKIVEECGAKIDLVVLDLHMPGMGGIDVLKSIREHQPDRPVIILTALHAEQSACERLGVLAFIRKPYSLKDLYGQIERVIGRHNEDKGEAAIEPGYEPYAKILVVDDEPEVCERLGTALAFQVLDAHFEIRMAFSGDEALSISREFEPDIGIIDIKMPHMWGDELIERFKAGEGRSPKDFVIYTSVADPGQEDRAKKLGYKLFSKPTDLETLVGVLRKICVRHKLLRKKA